MKERSVSPVSVESNPPTPLKTPYSPEELCKEPDYKKKCIFLSQYLGLEPVSPETRKGFICLLRLLIGIQMTIYLGSSCDDWKVFIFMKLYWFWLLWLSVWFPFLSFNIGDGVS